MFNTSILQGQLINWEEVRSFTPALYQRYITAPIWEIDSPLFTGPEHYHSYWCRVVQDMVMTSKASIGKWQTNGKQAAKAIEANQSAVTPIFDMEDAMAAEPLPIAFAMVQEKVSLLSSNPPMPMVIRQQESQEKQVAALNELMSMVLEGNNYESTCAEAIYDVQFWNTAILRWNIDPFKPGVFAQPGKITLEKCSPEDIFFDPTCKKLHADYMDYVIQKHEMEIGEIQHQYPLAASLVSSVGDDMLSNTSVTSRNNEDYIQSPQPKMGRDNAVRRQKITVLEAWIKDSRMKFEPKKNPLGKTYEERFLMNADGTIVGDWVPRYPNGRMIVVTSTAVLKDNPNPFSHGQIPFVFAQGMPATTPHAAGNAMRIMIVTRKINALIRDIMIYFKSEIKRPMYQSAGAIMDPSMQQNVPNDPSYILELMPNGRLERRPAVDVPVSVYSFLQLLQQMLDMVAGSGGVMRGQLEEGDQLSAEAVGQLQQFASSRLALEAKFFKVAAKQLFYQLMWIVRAIVKANIKVEVTLPTGTSMVVDWKSDNDVFERGDPTEIQELRAREDYLVTVKAGTGAPGAQAQQHAAFSQLYKEGAIDREAYLDGIQFPNRQAVVKRIRGQELEDINARATGRALGVSIGDLVKKSDGSLAGAKGKV